MLDETKSDIKLAHECLREIELAPYNLRAIGLVSCLFNLASDERHIICRNHANTCLRFLRPEVERVLHNRQTASEDQIEHWIEILNTIKKETNYVLPEEWGTLLGCLEEALERKLDNSSAIGALSEIRGESRSDIYRELRKHTARNRERILADPRVRLKAREIERREAELFCYVPAVVEAAARVTGLSVATVQKEWQCFIPEKRRKIVSNPKVVAMIEEMNASSGKDVNLDDLLLADDRNVRAD